MTSKRRFCFLANSYQSLCANWQFVTLFNCRFEFARATASSEKSKPSQSECFNSLASANAIAPEPVPKSKPFRFGNAGSCATFSKTISTRVSVSGLGMSECTWVYI